MTDLQDLLLDKLVGSPLGVNWTDGPFRVAAEMIPGKPIVFKGRHDDATAKNAIASRLGYPRILLDAAQGTVALLNDEDERRVFAMNVLWWIPPGTKQKARSTEVTWLAAVGVTLRAHRLLCHVPTCAVADCLEAALAAPDFRGREQASDRFFTLSCPTYGLPLDLEIRGDRKTPALARTIRAAGDCAGYYNSESITLYAIRAAREATRAAAQAGGVTEAVHSCIEIARRLGMQTG